MSGTKEVNSMFPDRSPGPMLEIFGPYPGKVLENDDSSDEDGPMGRIKVWIPHLHGEEYEDKAEDIPWALPMGMFNAGKGEDGVKRGTFFVPLKGMWTHVFFERGDINSVLYLGGWYAKPDGTPDLPTEFTESDYGGRYPEIPGIVFPPLSIQLHGVGTPQAATIKWGEDLLIEIDTVPYKNDDPTVAVKVLNEEWKLLFKSEGDITIESAKKLKLKAKDFEVEAEETMVMTSEDTSVIEAKNDNKFKSLEGRIVGVAPSATGFEDH